MVSTQLPGKAQLLPGVQWSVNRRYFVLHLPTSRMQYPIYALNSNEACYQAGWWVEDCFAHYVCEDVEYEKEKI